MVTIVDEIFPNKTESFQNLATVESTKSWNGICVNVREHHFNLC
jgi:hypothetical protein